MYSRPPFFGQGANQAIQDAYVVGANLANIIKQQNKHNYDPNYESSSLQQLVKKYESTRKMFTSILNFKSTVLGRLV